MLRIHDIRDLGEALVAPVAGGLRVLGTLLVVDDELDCHVRLVRPDHLRLTAAVADELSWGRERPGR